MGGWRGRRIPEESLALAHRPPGWAQHSAEPPGQSRRLRGSSTQVGSGGHLVLSLLPTALHALSFWGPLCSPHIGAGTSVAGKEEHGLPPDPTAPLSWERTQVS